MMNRSPDILFKAEYIKNVLYFATVRQGKSLKNTADTHYFCVDSELVYENYFSDFGPLNLGCVYKYCRKLNEKLKQYLNKQIIVHYTAIDPKKKANAAFLLGCYGVLYLSLPPRDALKPLMIHGQSYRPFQDATQGDSAYTISLMDCLQAIKKARDLNLFNFQDFNYEEYDRLDKLQGGDLNWIVPGKFLAFIGPVSYSVSLRHPPGIYLDYFLENNVKIVIRLNKRLYDSKIFSDVGIEHYDLFFQDGSCPPRHILLKFLQISEDTDCAIAVHCKAGLGRTGSLIGCYLMKHYCMTSHEAIGWMRICRPGSVIGQQQGWLEQLEAWLIKQGNFYRKRMYQDTERLPTHEFGIYSVAEKTIKQRPVVFHKSPSPPPPMHRQTHSDLTTPVRPQASKIREEKRDSEDEEVFVTSCDLTKKPEDLKMTQLKGCVIKYNMIHEEDRDNRSYVSDKNSLPLWKKLLFCRPCVEACNECLWTSAVRCARVAPGKCKANKFCSFLDMIAVNKTTEKDQYDWRVRTSKLSSQMIQNKREQNDKSNCVSPRCSGAGEPRPVRSPSRSSTARSNSQRNNAKAYESGTKNAGGAFHPTISTFRTTQGPIIKNINDARNFLMRSSMFNEDREKQLNSSVTVTPHYSVRMPNHYSTGAGNMTDMTPTSFISVSRGPSQPQHRRRLGRSPSPPQMRMSHEQTRATNTPTLADKFIADDASKSALKEVLSRLKLKPPREGSIGAASVGAASLGARREAPSPKRAPSVRSDERPLATQGDILNSIKFQRRFRDSLQPDKSNLFHNKISVKPKDKSSGNNADSMTSTSTRAGFAQEYTVAREKSSAMSRGFYSPARPSSPKGRRNSQTTSFF